MTTADRGQAFEDVCERWRTTMSGNSWPLKSVRRRKNLAAVTLALGLPANPKDLEALNAYEYAAAGWVWRDAEAPNLAPLLEDLRAAETRVGANLNVPPDALAAALAHTFLRAGGEPALASSGETREERVAFLQRAFDYAYDGRKTSFDRAQSRAAFRFGIALRDAEQVLADGPA
jgi:hypothetical protein